MLAGFGAQYLNLRYGLVTLICQHHAFGGPLACGIDARLVANLCLIRTKVKGVREKVIQFFCYLYNLLFCFMLNFRTIVQSPRYR